MTAAQLKKGVKAYQNMVDAQMGDDEILESLASNGYTQEEITQILKAATDGGDNGGEGGEKSFAFDKKNLIGNAWTAYKNHFDSLDKNTDLKFEQYKVEVVKKARYEGMAGSPVDVVGLKIKDDTPVSTTSINPRHAEELNRQVENTGRYFLIKQS